MVIFNPDPRGRRRRRLRPRLRRRRRLLSHSLAPRNLWESRSLARSWKINGSACVRSLPRDYTAAAYEIIG